MAGKKSADIVPLEPAPIVMNDELADILLNNLFSNVMRHTPKGAYVHISLQAHNFTISNTASNGPLDPEKLFKRFSKGGQSTDQHGLGLSIVQEISEVSGKKVSYHFENGQHVFSISF